MSKYEFFFMLDALETILSDKNDPNALQKVIKIVQGTKHFIEIDE